MCLLILENRIDFLRRRLQLGDQSLNNILEQLLQIGRRFDSVDWFEQLEIWLDVVWLVFVPYLSDLLSKLRFVFLFRLLLAILLLRLFWLLLHRHLLHNLNWLYHWVRLGVLQPLLVTSTVDRKLARQCQHLVNKQRNRLLGPVWIRLKAEGS